MSPDSESLPNSVPAVTASRFDRNGVTVYNLAVRVIDSPGAAWHATVAAFAATAERVPPGSPAGIDDQDLLLMGCWHARRLLSQLDADPAYAAQLRAHDAAQIAAGPALEPAAVANGQLPIDQRELLAMNGLGGLDHATLATLLHADPGLLAVMVAEARLMLHDRLRGGDLATRAFAAPEDRQAIALAALRQDDQLGGPEAQRTLETWLDADPGHREVVAALDVAADAYRQWTPSPVPAGLREAVVGATAGIAAPAAASGPATAEQPIESMPAGEHDRPAPTDDEPFDPSATVEWSSTEIAALGLEGAPVRAATPPGRRGPVVADAAVDDEGWGGDLDEPGLAPLTKEREPAPRWHIAVVGVLFIAVVVVLILTFTGKDEPTPATTPTDTTKTPTPKRTSTNRSGSSTQGAIRLPHATIRITL